MKGFYKNIILDDGEETWGFGERVFFTDGEVLSEDNKTSRDGWVWYDESPEGFLRWVENNELQ